MSDKELLKALRFDDSMITIGLNDEYAQMIIERRQIVILKSQMKKKEREFH